jgi:hypothetical protein
MDPEVLRLREGLQINRSLSAFASVVRASWAPLGCRDQGALTSPRSTPTRVKNSSFSPEAALLCFQGIRPRAFACF